MSEREPNQIRQSSFTLPMRKCGVTNAVKDIVYKVGCGVKKCYRNNIARQG
jgi:hypothetical protein